MDFSRSIQNFIKSIAQIPGIGSRQATRIAFFLLHQKKEFQKQIKESLDNLFEKTALCANCFFVFEPKNKEILCEICRYPQRNHSLICVVEKETDLLSIEKTRKYRGVYHILGGLISEMDENKKRELTIIPLLNRIRKLIKANKPPKEIILALSPTSEGNLTIYYLERQIKKIAPNIKITKLGRGLPHGGEVEFADSETLTNALEGRK